MPLLHYCIQAINAISALIHRLQEDKDSQEQGQWHLKWKLPPIKVLPKHPEPHHFQRPGRKLKLKDKQQQPREDDDSASEADDHLLDPFSQTTLESNSEFKTACENLNNELIVQLDDLQIDLSNDGDPAEIECSIGRVINSYLRFAHDRNGPTVMRNAFKSILEKAELPDSEMCKIIGHIDHHVEAKRNLQHRLQGHIIVTFPGSHEHMVQVARHFVKYIMEHTLRRKTVMLLHPDNGCYDKLLKYLKDDTDCPEPPEGWGKWLLYQKGSSDNVADLKKVSISHA